MTLRTDDRGQAIGLSRFFLSVFLVGSVLFFILSEVSGPLLNDASNSTTNQTMNDATVIFQDFVGLVPYIMLLTGFTGMVVLAVYRREVSR